MFRRHTNQVKVRENWLHIREPDRDVENLPRVRLDFWDHRKTGIGIERHG